MCASIHSSNSPSNALFDFFYALSRPSHSTLAPCRLATDQLSCCIDILSHWILSTRGEVQVITAHTMSWEREPSSKNYTEEQICEARALGVKEEDMLEVLVMTKDHGVNLEAALEAIKERRAAEKCPHCGEPLAGRIKRYRNRHINNHGKKQKPVPRVQSRMVEHTQAESPTASSASSTPPASPHSTSSGASSLSSPSHSPKRKADDEIE